MIKVFIKKNSLLFYFLLLSLLVIFLYLIFSDRLEPFHAAEQWINLLFQFAIGYVVNFMFFVTQVYIPSRRRELIMTQKISYRLSTILNTLRPVLTELSNIYLDNHTGNCFTDEELTTIANKLSLNDKVNVLISNVLNEHFTVRQWLLKYIKETKTEIDNLYRYFSADISEETIQVLEEILNSKYFQNMSNLLVFPYDVSFKNCAFFFIEYYHLICNLEQHIKEL